MTWIARGAGIASIVVLVSACSSSEPACECLEPGLTVNIPTDIATSVSGIQLSGTACTGVVATCTNQTGGCSQYRITPSATGTCHVEVDSVAGVFQADVTITQTSGCCAGLFASPASAATIDVPESDGGGS